MQLTSHYQVWIDLPEMAQVSIVMDDIISASKLYARKKAEGLEVGVFFVQPPLGAAAGMFVDVTEEVKACLLWFERGLPFPDHPVKAVQ